MTIPPWRPGVASIDVRQVLNVTRTAAELDPLMPSLDGVAKTARQSYVVRGETVAT